MLLVAKVIALLLNSNTTLVKVKYYYRIRCLKEGVYSNTTLVKVKFNSWAT